MLVRIEPKLDVCEGHRRVGKRIHHLPREKRVGEISLASRSDRSSELGARSRRAAPPGAEIDRRRRKFCQKSLPPVLKNVVFWQKKLAKQPRLRKMRQLNQLPRRAPTRELSERGTCMWVSGSDKQHGGKILGVIAFSRSEGNDQRER